MSESERQPTFIHLDSQPPDRTSRTSRHSQASAQTWNYTSQRLSREPPTIHIPSVSADSLIRSRPGFTAAAAAEFGNLDDEEYLSIEIDGPDLESASASAMAMENSRVVSPTSTKRSFGGRNFVGGFVNGLRKFPKVIRQGRKLRRKGGPPGPTRRGTFDTNESGRSSGRDDAMLPRYRSTDEAGPSGVQYVEATEFPVEEPASPATVQPPPSAAADHRLSGNPVPSSGIHSRPVLVPHALETGDEAAVHDVNLPTGNASVGSIDSPVLVEPLRSSDYARMGGHIHGTSERSFPSQAFNLGRFLKDLKALPWFSTRITTDYIPGQGATRPARKSLKPSSSWYKHSYHESLDLLSSGTSSSSTPPRSPYSHHSHSHHSHHSRSRNASISHTYPSADQLNTGRTTRHGRTRTRSHDVPRVPFADGHNYPVYPFPYPPYNYSPQPLFVMQPPRSQSASPVQPDAHTVPGFPDIRQAVPVYMVSPPLSPLGPDSNRERSGKHPGIHPYPLSTPLST